jgi:hypothetical protein
MITNTHSRGVVRDAVIDWRVKHSAADKRDYWWSTPVVAETWDGLLTGNGGTPLPRAGELLDVLHLFGIERRAVLAQDVVEPQRWLGSVLFLPRIPRVDGLRFA